MDEVRAIRAAISARDATRPARWQQAGSARRVGRGVGRRLVPEPFSRHGRRLSFQAAHQARRNGRLQLSLKIAGRVIDILEEQSGTGRNGPWRKQDFIIETEGEYPAQVCVTQWGDNIEKFAVQEGETLTAHIDLRSREYNGRWYTDVKAWRIEREEPATDQGPGPGSTGADPGETEGVSGGPGAPGQASPPLSDADFDEDDLPF